jgi:hypothetical protein
VRGKKKIFHLLFRLILDNDEDDVGCKRLHFKKETDMNMAK